MKVLTVIACLAVCLLSEIHSAPPDADKTQPAASANPTFRFASYNGDPTNPKNIDFQIKRLDVSGPTHFYKLGDTVTGTKLKLTKFDFKTRQNPKGGDEDVSELTLVNTETKESIVLVLGTRSP